MSDIIDRLRAREIVTEPGEPFTMLTVRPWFTENVLLREDAADEIQRLRAEREMLREALREITDSPMEDAYIVARAALSETEHDG